MSESTKRPAVFLDKDGTLLDDVPYNIDPALLLWHSDTFGSLHRLQAAGFALVLVTNQSGVAHGRFTESELERYLGVLRQQLTREGVFLNAIMYCPHHPRGVVAGYRRFCACRKPNPGMLASAASRLDLDLERSWMVGDLLDDVEAGKRAGCLTALVRHDGNERIPLEGVRRPDVTTQTLAEAVQPILVSKMAVAS